MRYRYLFLALFAIFSLIHLYYCFLNDRKGRVRTKPLLIITLLIFYLKSAPEISYLLAAALVASWIGDILLIGNGEKWLVTGGAFFIAANANGYYSGDLAIDHESNKVTIIPNQFRPEQLVRIHSDIPQMREDMVRVGMGTADIRYRGEFSNWYADIVVKYNRNGQYTPEQIVNIINAGGSVCGVGEWRPEKDGQYGMYHVG